MKYKYDDSCLHNTNAPPIRRFCRWEKKLLYYVGGERSDSFDLSSVWENSTKSHIKSDKSILYFSQPSREQRKNIHWVTEEFR